jgi:NADPH:quinone reductase-like Zn-dependent oxidoreductase
MSEHSMQAIVINRQGTPVAANVQVEAAWPRPVAGAGEVLVRTEASALNHLDLWVGRGLPGIDLTYPRISGSDGCGIVEAVGEGVDPAWIGRRVIVNAAVPQPEPPYPGLPPAPADIRMLGEHDPGCLGAFFTAPAASVLEVGGCDPLQAAAFGLTHLTAWRMLRTRAQVAEGDVVLITGIGGGVALAALGLCRHLGCTTIVTSRSAEKLARAKELGADHAVLDRGEEWSREVRVLTGRRGVDVCIDSVGGPLLGACLKSLARGGRFVTCGTTAGAVAPCDLARIFWNQLSILGSTMGSMAEFRAVVALLRSGGVTPVIDSVFLPHEGRNAFERLESASQFGKIVVDWRGGHGR